MKPKFSTERTKTYLFRKVIRELVVPALTIISFVHLKAPPRSNNPKAELSGALVFSETQKSLPGRLRSKHTIAGSHRVVQ
jgi:hypothetical protein